MKHKLFLLFGAIGILFSAQQAFAAQAKIVALVNSEIISSDDLKSRINAFLLNSQIPLNAQTSGIITQRALESAINDKIKLQEAAKNNIEITPEEVKNALSKFEKNNKIPSGQLDSVLKNANVNPDTLAEQAKADLAWTRLIRKKSFSEGQTSQKEIETALAEAKLDLNTPKYLVSEIYIKKDKARNLNELVYNLRNDPRFELYAMQFSDSPSASNGGDLGWVNEGKLPSTLEVALKKMHEGDVSDPIQVGEGYYILKLQKTFKPQKNGVMPSQKDIQVFLENQKMDLISKKLLQDARQKAVIEIRN